MPQDLKISELPERSFSSFLDITDSNNGVGEPSMYVPTAQENTNKSINFVTICKLIKSYINTIKDGVADALLLNTTFLLGVASRVGSNSGGGSSGGGSGGSSSDLTDLLNRVNTLRSEMDHLKTISSWPTHTIYIVDTSTNQRIPYMLPTGPDLSANTITIKLSGVIIPNFYVTYCMGLPYFSDGHLNTNVQLNIENRNAGLNLEGGTIGIISLYGTITATVDGVSLTYTIATTYSAWQLRELPNGSLSSEIATTGNNPIHVTSDLTISGEVNITGATLYCRFGTENNDPVVPGSNVFVNSGSGSTIMPTSGYITLSNGS